MSLSLPHFASPSPPLLRIVQRGALAIHCRLTALPLLLTQHNVLFACLRLSRAHLLFSHRRQHLLTTTIAMSCSARAYNNLPDMNMGSRSLLSRCDYRYLRHS